MMRRLNIPSLFLAAVLLAACSSSGSLQLNQAKTAPIPPGKTVALDVSAELPADADKDKRNQANEVMHRLKAQLFGRLMSEGVFRQVVQPGEAADYRMEVELGDAREVSQGARIFLGVFAGSNSLDASVTLYDQATNTVVTAFDVKGESASHPLSTESGLDDAVREAVSEIMLALQ